MLIRSRTRSTGDRGGQNQRRGKPTRRRQVMFFAADGGESALIGELGHVQRGLITASVCCAAGSAILVIFSRNAVSRLIVVRTGVCLCRTNNVPLMSSLGRAKRGVIRVRRQAGGPLRQAAGQHTDGLDRGRRVGAAGQHPLCPGVGDNLRDDVAQRLGPGVIWGAAP